MCHVKRLILVFTCLVFLTTSLCPTASAIEVSPRAILYLTGYTGSLSQGTKSGRIRVDFTVIATQISDYVGVSQIAIFEADTNTRIAAIKGSVVNGLLREDARSTTGSYTYYGKPGVTYYAVLTIYAEKDGGSDFRMYTTNNCTAPS